jgi:hypothetical protein
MRLLRSKARIETRFGGRFVQKIGGLEGLGAEKRRDWFFFVNGVESDTGAAEYGLSGGDVVQWDYRDWTATQTVTAIVGAFPEPFLHGLHGKKLPVRVECGDSASKACTTAKDKLRDRGVAATGASLGTQFGEKSARVVVALWPKAKIVAPVARIADGPGRSGIYARVRDDRLELLDPKGNVARVARPGTGLVAAIAPSRDRVIWVVTALDEAGLNEAARALDSDLLRNAFAVAIGPEGILRLPLGASR